MMHVATGVSANTLSFVILTTTFSFLVLTFTSIVIKILYVTNVGGVVGCELNRIINIYFLTYSIPHSKKTSLI